MITVANVLFYLDEKLPKYRLKPGAVKIEDKVYGFIIASTSNQKKIIAPLSKLKIYHFDDIFLSRCVYAFMATRFKSRPYLFISAVKKSRLPKKVPKKANTVLPRMFSPLKLLELGVVTRLEVMDNNILVNIDDKLSTISVEKPYPVPRFYYLYVSAPLDSELTYVVFMYDTISFTPYPVKTVVKNVSQ